MIYKTYRLCMHTWMSQMMNSANLCFSIVHVQLIQTWGVMPIQASQFKTKRFAWRCSFDSWRCSFDSLRCSAGIPALLRHPRGEAPSVLGGFTQSWWIVKLTISVDFRLTRNTPIVNSQGSWRTIPKIWLLLRDVEGDCWWAGGAPKFKWFQPIPKKSWKAYLLQTEMGGAMQQK